ncbi:TetR/AcrR family transcriptional regulator [Polaribacter undariae]|uniref:TetR/AcrR family transcriptional regulator n=1 Tax=Polaribacter sejongensis TaxID=985043 RepID=A0AAJ1QX79_9FLAO|nr:TetR/AcrR family transcriptional regulator [Polaribacter undariae]MDN3619563.1 TetR/AcrR family transcriptional regulator [Polaribacter undariae]UWD32323.1 TetR/AcrR family transcriptional regulator [Polaribacter undariae]
MKSGNSHSKELVFEKTEKLLLSYGVKGWNMNDLAKECNMSKRTLYKIIGNKEDLLYEISLNSISKNINNLKKYLESNSPFPLLLQNLSDQIINSFDKITLSNIIALRIEYPRIKEMGKSKENSEKDFFIDFFQKGKDENCISDNVEASTIHKIVHALIEYHIYNCDNKTEFKNEMKEVLNAYFNGILR